MKIYYNKSLKHLAARLRKNSTKAEIKLWSYLKNRQIMNYDFHRQKSIDKYIVDFFCNKLKLAIEVDGYTHGLEEVYEKDNLKNQRLNQLGITVLRFSDEEVMNNVDGVVTMMKKYIEVAERSNTPPAPLDRGEVRKRNIPPTPLDRGEVRKRNTPRPPLDRGEIRKRNTPRPPLDRGEIRKRNTPRPPLDRGEVRKEGKIYEQLN